MTRVSVIIPTYNRADLIGQTLQSVLAQTYTEFEILVVDDGSTDGTVGLLNTYDQPQVRIIRQANQGEGMARNAGIRAARGEYLAFVDSDDLWEPTKLERQMDILGRSKERSWAFCDAYVFESETGRKLYTFSQRCHTSTNFTPQKLLLCDYIASPTPVIHSSIFEEVGLFNTSPIAADWDMWLRIASRYPIHFVSDVLAGYRIHGGMVSRNQSPLRMHYYCVETIERAATLIPDVYGPVRRRALSAQARRTGRMFVSRGQLREARALFTQAIHHYPIDISSYIYWLLCAIDPAVVQSVVRLGQWWRRRRSKV